ncbi:MAG: sensor histidine kinase [Phototrophicaceae bacterium]
MTNHWQVAHDKLNALIHQLEQSPTLEPSTLLAELKSLQSTLPNHGEAEQVILENARFLSVAIHELRTPITSVRGYADMLTQPAMGELNPMQKTFLGTIRNNAKRMGALLSDISDINKLRSHTLKLNIAPHDVEDLIAQVEDQSGNLAEELKRTLTVSVAQGLSKVTVDKDFFPRMMMKLVENALQYSPSDTEIRLMAHQKGEVVVVVVADEGIGMTQDELKMIGTLYWRSDHEVVRQYKGSGLGLAVALGLAREMGITVKIESVADKGTTITLEIPCLPALA